MHRIENRVRASLEARALDVEPTPELWDEVNRRISRRQRFRVTAWALAGAAAAAVVAIVAVPGLLGSGITVPEVEPTTPGPAPAEEPEDATDGPSDDAADPGTDAPDEDTDEASGPAVDLGVLQEPVVVIDNRDLLLLQPSGAVVLVSLDLEGESRFLSVDVRPGSTVDDLTIVTTTVAEGFTDVRWTRVIDGQVVVAHEAFEGQYAPAAATSDQAYTSAALWSPDGGSVAWLDIEPSGTTLRTVGWDDGPGTGDPANDNAATGLTDTAWPPDVDLQGWVSLGGTRSILRATHPDSMEGWYEMEIERQADGALSFGTPAVRSVPGQAGQVGAVAGDLGEGAPRWLVRTTFDGIVLEDRGDGREVDLPASLAPGDGFIHLWARPHGDGVLVGSRNTSTAVVVIGDVVTTLDLPIDDGSRVR